MWFTVEEWVSYFCEHYPTVETLSTAMGRVGRNNCPALVMTTHVEVNLRPALAAWAVQEAWSGAEHPMMYLDKDEWLELFDLAGYTVNGKPSPRPTEAMTVYRGSDAEHCLGWSWTEDVALAQWFADRVIHTRPGIVWRARVEPVRLLARITESRLRADPPGFTETRGESEWVVDTGGLDVQAADALDGVGR
jgi:hypothetical protein